MGNLTIGMRNVSSSIPLEARLARTAQIVMNGGGDKKVKVEHKANCPHHPANQARAAQDQNAATIALRTLAEHKGRYIAVIRNNTPALASLYSGTELESKDLSELKEMVDGQQTPEGAALHNTLMRELFTYPVMHRQAVPFETFARCSCRDLCKILVEAKKLCHPTTAPTYQDAVRLENEYRAAHTIASTGTANQTPVNNPRMASDPFAATKAPTYADAVARANGQKTEWD